jgi:probable O-glycosylation ligase (exosortase A-associated)
MFIWVIVFSLGFYGVKGGIFTILTGGSSHVVGPEGTFIEGNNELALAIIMTIPLVRYLHLHETNKWLKRGLGAALLLCAIAVVGSQSRGALVGLVLMGFVFWLKSSNKLPTAMLILVSVMIIVPLMPASWYSRMDTINTYEEDESALSRINAWKMSVSVANANLTGGGFNMYRASVYAQYAERPEWVFDAHSIYFKMLGEHGYIGLGLFLAMIGLTWKKCSNIIRKTRKRADLKWANDLAAMIQASLIGYLSAGAFLGQCYFDYIYHLVAVVVVLGDLVGRALREPEVALEQKSDTTTSLLRTRRFSARPATPPASR